MLSQEPINNYIHLLILILLITSCTNTDNAEINSTVEPIEITNDIEGAADSSTCDCSIIDEKVIQSCIEVAYLQVIGSKKIIANEKLSSKWIHTSPQTFLDQITANEFSKNGDVQDSLIEQGLFIDWCDNNWMKDQSENYSGQWRFDNSFTQNFKESTQDTSYQFSIPVISCNQHVFAISIMKKANNYSGGSEYVFFLKDGNWKIVRKGSFG
ncbi:hypothetical protein K6119_11345 [Paracrocinitomix mangrovi]|uniref:hypothetical protein n=1 Tax=Paracrocinitomix mangrovi TaxID=2862509 RepID=UPI001C8DF8BD|nr:hypothetical protein [Paracrocinitomix mangrovi]UKN00329.1 hypothetical protein K6119_11345 [Paracrocinitomix mangrovi]